MSEEKKPQRLVIRRTPPRALPKFVPDGSSAKTEVVSSPSLISPPTSSSAATSTSQSEPQRRVYALPQELVERIVEFQREKGFTSEVEAVRRLLDDALKSRDDLTKLINRFLSRLANLRISSEAAKDVLVGHPLVKSLAFGDNLVEFTLKNGETAEISDDGRVLFPELANRTWRPFKNSGQFGPGSIEDEIPF